MLRVLRPEVREATGRVDLNIRVGGTTAKPNLIGRGTISGGLLAIRDTPLVIRDIEAHLVLSPSRLRVEDLEARLGAGTVKVSGEAGLDGGAIGAYQVAITARGVNLAAVE